MTRTGPRRPDKKTLAGLGGGVGLEWYDWNIYGLLAAFLGPKFFPGDDPVSATLSALGVFALGFVARPVGAAIFGPVADRVSHKKVMLFSVSTMGLTSLLTGLLPTYEQVGAWASVLLIVLRLIQGLATGAEAPIANVIAMELAPPGRSGWYLGVVSGSFIQGGILFSMLVAFASSTILGTETMHDWGWRVPFLIGGVMSVAVLYLRRQLPETLLRESFGGDSDEVPAGGSVWRELGRNWTALVAMVLVVGGVQILNYTWTTGLPNLANATYKENSGAVFGIIATFGVLMVAAGPVIGALADRFGPTRVYTAVRTLGIPTMCLLLLYSSPGLGTFAFVVMIGGVVVAANMGLYNFIATSLMPRTCRTTGVGLGYALGVSLFGGTASYLLVQANRTDYLWLYVLYAAVIIALSVVVYHLVARRQARITDAGGQRPADPLSSGPVSALAHDSPPSHLTSTRRGGADDDDHLA
jgi:MHS family alpha-ketoglutarate permease-like MFS transporter